MGESKANPYPKSDSGNNGRENDYAGTLFYPVALFTFASAFLCEILGFFTHQLNLAMGVLLLIWATITYLPIGRPRIKTYKFWLGAALMLLAFASLRVPPYLRPMIVCVYLLGLYQVLASAKRQAPEITALALGVFTFGVLLTFEKSSPLVWSFIHAFSRGFSSVIAGVAGRHLSMAACFSGLYITFLLISVSVFLFLSSIRKKPVNILIIVVGLLAANGVAIALSHPLAHILKILVHEGKPGVSVYDRALLSIPLLVFFLELIPLYFFRRFSEPVDVRSGRKRPGLGWAALLFLFLSILVLFFQMPGTTPPSVTVAFYQGGYCNWFRPMYGQYGSESGGMFGNLPVFAEALGFKSVLIDSIDSTTLDGINILFMANNDEDLPAHSYEDIRKFVEQGGSLLFLGDHTFFKEEKTNWLNAVLKPFRIKYNFDSADYFIGGWLHSYFYPANPFTVGLSDEENEAGSVVGASLSAAYPAVPVLLGRYGFSDKGDSTNEESGYLGNLDYDAGERLGDVVLAAAQNYGKGKILIFGDTSGFVNALMVDTYPFLNRVFTWLASDAKVPAYGLRLLLSLALLAAFVALTLLSGLSWARLICMPVLVVVAVVAGLSPLSGKLERPIGGRYTLVDGSHNERYMPDFWRPNGLMGLHLNLMRKGCLSLTMRKFDPSLLDKSELLVLVAPSRPFSGSEVKALDTYVRNGGLLFLAVGYEEKKGSQSILRHFGFDIANTPLGAFYTNLPNSEQIVIFHESWPVTFSDTSIEAVAGRGEYPTIALRKHGNGNVVVFGDSEFFSNLNLETEETPLMENIEFLRWFLDQLKIREET